jgi:hypothetical protein
MRARPLSQRAGTALCTALAAAPLLARTGGGEPNAPPPNARAILEEAFDRRYEVDLSLDIELVMRGREGAERRRRFRAASKRIDGRMHSIGRIVWPDHLRGMTILTIEAPSRRGHDSFVYMPTMDKVRRVSTAQRSDSFLGSDVTYEDLERRHPEDFLPQKIRVVEVDGERAWEIRARPDYSPNYERIAFVIAQGDYAILETRYYKWEDEEPYRVVEAPRAAVVSQDGYTIPTYLKITNFRGGTTTEVIFTHLVVNPGLDDRIFSVATLERDRGNILGD